MDAIVSARVPIALKERGNGILHDIGSTPTQLINAAYQFVLAEHELPKPHDPLEGMRGTKRELTDEQKEKVRRSLKAMYVGRPPQTSHSHVNSTPQGMSAMRVLLDTNVLIDLYTQRPPEGDIAQKLLVMKEFGDVELWVSAKSFTDVFYVLHKTYSSDYVQSAFEESYQWLEICSVDSADIHRATSRRWADFEDCLVDVCAEKVKADFLLTRDEKGFAQAHVPVMSPGDFFNYIESEYQITYDIVDLSEEAD